MPKLVIFRSQLSALDQEVINAPDVEVCGFLVGRAVNDDAHVTRVVCGSNIDYQPDRFAISPREYNQLAAALPPGEDVVGIFHSHGGEPLPSPDDLSNMRHERFIWLIIGNSRAGRLDELSHAAFARVGPSIQTLALSIVDT
jgi:proteasome lid subunit RPN8/RPN11